ADEPGMDGPPDMDGEPGTNGEPERLVAPTLSANPTQAERGAHEFALRCMACHGDRGQGLTDEWRAAWGVEEQNCWQSKCHAANHPPEGFELLPFAPQVIGQGALSRFETAADLHDFICTNMPWQNPGSLEDAMCWQLTAFLLRANDIVKGVEPVTAETATTIILHERAPAPVDKSFPSAQQGISQMAVAGGTALGLGALTLLLVLRRRDHANEDK
ncbi:MAG: hypothetical protein ACREQ3_26120, partial [Candidatus Binatia bacterium]